MNPTLLNQIISVYLVYTSEYFVAYAIICSSFELKISKPKAYLLGFICSNFYTITDTLFYILILTGTLPETSAVTLTDKITAITAEVIMVIFLNHVVHAWYKVYWYTFVAFTFLSLSLQFLYINRFLKASNGFYEIVPISLHNLALYLLPIIVNIIIGILLSLVARYAIYHTKRKALPKWVWFVIYSIFWLMLASSPMRLMESSETSDYNAMGNYIYVLLSFAVMAILTMIFATYSNMKYLKLENNLLKKQQELQYANYLSLQQKELKIHELYHEMGNHMNAIQLLISNEENEGANSYTQHILEDYRKLYRVLYCENMIINAVLIQKHDICANNQIEFDVDILIPEQLPFRDMDLMSVYANLLDNAIEGCLRNNEDKNYIHVRTLMVGDYFTVKVVNSKSSLEHTQINTNRELMTTKKDKTMHGYGMKIIKEIVERYDGKMEIVNQGKEFSAMVMLRIMNS